MKIHFLKLKNWLLITLMGVMGLSSCHCHKQVAKSETESEPVPVAPPAKPNPSNDDRGEMKLMYGVPTMNFMIRGQVKDAAGKPVKDIRVNMLERNMEVKNGELQGDPESISRWLEGTEVRTDNNGRFEINNSGIPQEQVRLMVRDADGKENGEFKDRMVEMEVTPENVDRTNAGGWNQGTFNKQVEIKLEDK